MAALETGYQPLFSYSDAEDNPEHTVHYTESSRKGQWQMKDLDLFFKRVYDYHQGGGFNCLILKKVTEIIVIMFMCSFTLFLMCGVNYPVLFMDVMPDKVASDHKITLQDAIYSFDEFTARIGAITVLFLSVSIMFFIILIYKLFCHISQNIEIRDFYTKALNISPSDIDNLTWYDVQKMVLEVQKEEHVCVHKRDLTELDIYHRILRYKNYMVAMINKEILPIKVRLPCIGETPYLSKGLHYNLELVLFRSPWAPFQKWQLRPDYKNVANREKLARELSRHLAIVALMNLLLSPFIFVWQILYHYYAYAAKIKLEPEFLAVRQWSQYARLYLRHFNELDHELNARLCRGYRPAKQYIEMFSSRMLTILLHPVKFMCTAVLAVLFCLTMYDNDVVQVDQVLTLVAALGIILAALLAMFPDPNMVWRPAHTMRNVIAHIHYIPDHWRGKEHTQIVRNEFSALFQYRATYFLEELVSPLMTPLILYFRVRRRAQDIVDFFRNFTVEVTGVGDVCSFAQMDVRNHGNPKWLSEGYTQADQFRQAEDGKTELSLIHFTCTNPAWVPPDDANHYLQRVRQQVQRDGAAARASGEANALTYSLQSMSSFGPRFVDLLGSYSSGHPLPRPSRIGPVKNVLHQDGPVYFSTHNGIGIISELQSMSASANNVMASMCERPCADEPLIEWSAARMSLSALYMHGVQQMHEVVDDGTEGLKSVITNPTDHASPGEHERSQTPGAESLPLLPMNR